MRIPTSIGSPPAIRNSSARDGSQSSLTAWAGTRAARRPAAWRWRRFAKSIITPSATIRRPLWSSRLPPLTPVSRTMVSGLPPSMAWAPTAPPRACTALVLRGRQLYFAHVGDSRLYLVRSARILRLTRDHSYVGRLVESGIVRAEDAEKHPQRHILTAALGAGRDVAVDGAEHGVALQDGDDLLLCTDGLWSVVTEEELETAVSRTPPAQCSAPLLNLASQHT